MIEQINILDNNVNLDCDLISIHNPIVFFAEVIYSGDTPEELEVVVKGVNEETELLENLGTFKCMPYRDNSNVSRTFVFVADSILRSFMSDFQDFKSETGVIEYCSGMTKEFTLVFGGTTETSFIALHAARDFGENQQLIEIFNNEKNNTYYGMIGKPVYVYFYNQYAGNEISENAEFEYWADFDDILFEDSSNLLNSL